MKKQDSIGKRSAIVLLYSTLTACSMIIPLSYINYIYTDIAGVSPAMMSAGMSIANIVGLVFSLFTGMLIQKTRSRLGQYRPWILVCGLLTLTGTFMTLIHFGSALTTCVFITVGYTLASVTSDTVGTANYGMVEKMTMGDNDARNKLYSMQMAGSNIGYTIFAAILLTLVEFFGKGDEAKGFIGAEVVIAVCMLVSIAMIFMVGRRYDGDNRKAEAEELPAVSVGEMLRGTVSNKALLAVVIAELFKFCGYNMFTYMMVYQCSYVLGDLNFMTITLTAMSVICAVAAMVAPAFVKLCKGRKRASIALYLLCAASYGVMMFTGDTLVGFLIPFVAACTFEGIYLGVSINCYLDASEWWYDKTGKDTRTFAMSLQAIGSKAGMAISSLLLGVALTLCHYSDELGIATTEGMRACTIQTGVYSMAGCLIAAVILLLFHKVSDKEMEACIERNAQRDAEMFAGME